jgi:hypothetical protein
MQGIVKPHSHDVTLKHEDSLCTWYGVALVGYQLNRVHVPRKRRVGLHRLIYISKNFTAVRSMNAQATQYRDFYFDVENMAERQEPGKSSGKDATTKEDIAIMSMEKHKALFDAIIHKYELKNDEKASEIAEFLTSIDGEHDEARVSAVDFANKFGMTESEARIFLSWISVGIKFKEESDKVKRNL